MATVNIIYKIYYVYFKIEYHYCFKFWNRQILVIFANAFRYNKLIQWLDIMYFNLYFIFDKNNLNNCVRCLCDCEAYI